MSIPVDFDPLPSTTTWGKVVGRVIHGVADTAEDSNDKPQARSAAGSVHFTPKNTLSKTPAEADYTALIIQGRETAGLSSSGRILDAEGRQGIWLIAGVWEVSFQLEGGATIKPFLIEVKDTHTDAAPLDLATEAPYTPPGGLLVKTMLIPTGGTDGQVLTYDESGNVVWSDPSAGVTSYTDLTDVPTTFPPSTHSHPTSQVTGLDTALSGKAATSHTHTTAQVTGLDTALSGKAATSHTHTASQVTNFTTEVQSLVSAGISATVNNAPATLDTLGELADALGDDPNFATTMTNLIGGKANTSHAHATADVTGLDAALSDRMRSAVPFANETSYLKGQVTITAEGIVAVALQDQTTAAAPATITVSDTWWRIIGVLPAWVSDAITTAIAGKASTVGLAGAVTSQRIVVVPTPGDYTGGQAGDIVLALGE